MKDASHIDRLIKIKTAEGEREVDIYSEEGFRVLANLWTRSGWERKISYEITWLGIPIIQLPEDMVIVQELIWREQPDVIVECGVAHGGSLVLYSSLLELIGKGRVIGVDIEIRKHNRLAIESHSMSKRVSMIEASSIDPGTVQQVRQMISSNESVMVMLDSNHSRQHVSQELELYSDLVTPGSYLIVFDGVMPLLADAPRGSADWEDDNPASAVRDFLIAHPEFKQDHDPERLQVTYCQGGFLRREEGD